MDAVRVLVEADAGDGLPSFEIVGSLNIDIREARERVRSALRNSGIEIPPCRLTVSLSPADLKKSGNAFDLPIAVAILVSCGIIPEKNVSGYHFIGELSLNGQLLPVQGTISHVLRAHRENSRGLIVPSENAKEGALLSLLDVYGFQDLSSVVAFLLSDQSLPPEKAEETEPENKNVTAEDFSDILGQESVKRAASVACAGMHGLLMIGPPGSGKTLTVRRTPSILPPLTRDEQIECSKIYSAAGLLSRKDGLVKMRPFRSPHHTMSPHALVGGGSIPRPGEMSLAHNGVLFLDELPEFSRSTLEVMRQPLEDHQAVISRVNGSFVFPSRVMLVCAMNPCRCGYYPDRNRCRCTEAEVHRYLSRISRPLLDRIDIVTEVQKTGVDALQGKEKGTSSEGIRVQVMRAWEIQKRRFSGENIVFNSSMNAAMVRKYCVLGNEESDFLKSVFERLDFSARAYDRILKVARTVADLSGEDRISVSHLSEAVSYRMTDRKYWGS